MKVLLIDDNLILSELIKLYLKKHNIKLEVRHTMKDGKLFLKENNNDLILLDLCLPDSPPEDTLKEIRELSKFSTVVVISGWVLPDLKEKVIREGGLTLFGKENLGDGQLVQLIEMLQT